jgi:hypothetical protein
LAKEGPDYVSVAVGTSRGYLGANDDILRRVVRSYTQGVYLFKTNKAAALKMIQNQLRVGDIDIQEDTHDQFRQYLEYPPYVKRKAMEAVLTELADKENAAKAAKPEDFMDMRFVGGAREGGFLQAICRQVVSS